MRILLDLTAQYHVISREAERQYYGAKRSYASHCFSRLIDQTRWRYGTGYGGISDNGMGELHNVAGTHVLPVRWYIVGADGPEDIARTRRILDAALPYWLQERAISEPDMPALPPFEEEPDGHYLPVS